MAQTKLHELNALGQSIWLDYISRSMLQSGKLQEWIDSGLRGMTSNPTIFNQAISNSTDYDEQILNLSESQKSVWDVYDELTTQDVRQAADIFKNVYEQSHYVDGYVSLEINPRLAFDTQASIHEGKRLYSKVNRPNVMIKVPATQEGFPVVEELLACGIPVNVTLIFSLKQYMQTTQAFLKGMTRLSQHINDLDRVHSVASVFVSRIDTAVDKMLDARLASLQDQKGQETIESLYGQAAVANCRQIFAAFKETFNLLTFQKFSQKKAGVQRVLWASTGTKNPKYSDIKYVTELMASLTVNTLPEKTLQAVVNHGMVFPGVLESNTKAQSTLATLKQFDIDVDAICQQLLKEGLKAFEDSFEQLLLSIENKMSRLCVK